MSRAKVKLAGNPVREARRSLGKSIKKIASEAGIHEQAWYLTECGCYSRIPPRIARYFSKRNIPINVSNYDKYRKRCQMEFGEIFFEEYRMPDASLKMPPLEAFLEINHIPNRTFFAKAICIQPSLIYRTLLGNVRELPAQIKLALSNAGISPDDVYDLNERTIEYYEYINRR